MTSETAPERIWAQDADPSECNYIGGGWWDDECGNVQYSNTVEYTRTDIHRAAIAKKDARIAELEAEDQRVKSDRPWIVGWNDGFVEALTQAMDIARLAYTRCATGREIADQIDEIYRAALFKEPGDTPRPGDTFHET